MPRWTSLARGFAVVLAAGCHAPLPASVAALGENVEEFSASAQGKIGTSYVLGELAVEMRVVPPATWGRNEEYHVVAYGKRVGTFHCTARRAGIQYAFGEHEQLQCGDGRSWSLQLVYANWRFPREMNRLVTNPLDSSAATGAYAIEAELSETANVFRFWPARSSRESNFLVPVPGTKPVAAAVHQPSRNAILLDRDAQDHDALLAAAAIVMTMADRVHPGHNPCSSGSLPGERMCIRGPE